LLLFYVPFALFIFYAFNTMTQKFCTKSEMSNEKSVKVYRMINISMLVLLISSYYEVNFL